MSIASQEVKTYFFLFFAELMGMSLIISTQTIYKTYIFVNMAREKWNNIPSTKICTSMVDIQVIGSLGCQ